MLSSPSGNSRTLQARIVSGSVVLLSGSILATAVNLAYNVAVARFLGPTGFGHATVVYTLLTIISAVTLSFQIVSAKVVAQQNSADGKGAAYRDLHRAAWTSGILVALALLLFRRGISAWLNLPSPLLIVLLAAGAAFYIPLGTRRGYTQGACGFRRLASNLVLEGAVRLGGSVLMAAAGFGVTGVIAANAAAMAVAWAAIAPRLAPPPPGPLRFRLAWRESLQALVFFSGQMLINNCDIVLVKHYFAPTAAGLYAAVAMVGRVVFSFSSAVMNGMFPVVAGTRDEERRGLSLIATSLALVLLIGSILAIGLRLAPESLWSTLFGSGFRIAGPHGLSYLLALKAVATVIYSLSAVIIAYEMSYRIAHASWLQFAFTAVVVAGICRFHSSLQQVIVVQFLLMIVLLVLVGVPFLATASRNAAVRTPAVLHSIRLIRRISEDEVIAGFLQSDFENPAYHAYQAARRALVFSPDFDDPGENDRRRALLFMRHFALWKELPSDTEWYEFEVGTAGLGQIRVFPRAHWRKIARGDFAVTGVVQRMLSRPSAIDHLFQAKIDVLRRRLARDEPIPGSIVLIGINQSEPLTVLDGNHRLVAAVLEGKAHRLRFLCGFSPRMVRCCWYRTNLLTLMLYGRNTLRHVMHHPEAELARLFENSG